MASIFSKIIAGEIPGEFVCQTEHWVGLLDLFPVSPGHLLLIPRREVPRWQDLDEASLTSYGAIAAQASRCLYGALGCDAISVLLRDGTAAGQEIPHVHVHLVPRYDGDEPHRFGGGRYGGVEADDETSRAAMQAMGTRLREAWG